MMITMVDIACANPGPHLVPTNGQRYGFGTVRQLNLPNPPGDLAIQPQNASRVMEGTTIQHDFNITHTVDGRNPVPPGMVETL